MHSESYLRQVLSFLSGVAVAAAGLLICRWMVLSLGMFGSTGVFALPVAVGLIAGCVMRVSCADGSFNLASAGVAVILVFSMICSGIRHKLLFDQRLKQDADATYSATRTYAQEVVPLAADNTALRHLMFTNRVSVIGRITPIENGEQPDEYWKDRNFIHLHWVAAGRIVLCGQDGVDRTIADASQVLGDSIFLDKIVPAISKNNAVTDGALRRFRKYELPYLEQMKDGKITADDFEQPLIQEVSSHENWLAFAANGFDQLAILTTLSGCIVIYKLVRQPSDTEMV